MIIKKNNSRQASNNTFAARSGERGAALAAALLMLGLLSAVAMTVLAVVTTETRIAGSDLKRTQTFYASAAGIEKMTSDYSALFQQSARPTNAQIDSIADAYPPELVTDEHFTFVQSIARDDDTLAAMRATQNIAAPKLPYATLPADSPYVGLIASVDPFLLKSRATFAPDGTSVTLHRTMNNYLIPLFQFGMFSDNDIELHPGQTFNFNGRVHANGNIYLSGKVKLFDKVTSAHELIFDMLRNGQPRSSTSAVSMGVGTAPIDVPLSMGSLNGGPHIAGSVLGDPNYFPTSPVGTVWPVATFVWETTSVQSPLLGPPVPPNRFGSQLLTRLTGASKLKLPMQLDGNLPREIIKRRLASDNLPAPADSSALSDSRYHSKGGIRILIDDEGVVNDAAGIDKAQNGDGVTNAGVNLSTFDPIPLPNQAGAVGGRALWRVPGAGAAYTETAANCPYQQNAGIPGGAAQALTVRSARTGAPRTNFTPTGSAISIPKIPTGAGLSGHILIQIEATDGTWRDVTREILSMGMTVGEPNAIVHLQRPLWAAFMQGSKDALGVANQNLTDMLNNTYWAVDGEIQTSTAPPPLQNGTYGFITGINNDTCTPAAACGGTADTTGAHAIRVDTPAPLVIANWGLGAWNTQKHWNAIVPINVYNVREGRLSTAAGSDTVTSNAVYERGITSVVEINMKNLARWVDGVYDLNLLANTPAVSANIKRPDGYVVYVSDRRGDNVKAMTVSDAGTDPVTFSTIQATNGMADNVDIFGPNDTMDPGENVQETTQADGTALVKDELELPDPVSVFAPGTNLSERTRRAFNVAAWPNVNNFFRRSVRLFNAEDLQIIGASLSTTRGITIATENMVYTWGNYNTTGIDVIPTAGTSSLNESAAQSNYLPIATLLCPTCDRQVPASIVADAWFPLSKTWFDGSSAMYPEDLTMRRADLLLPLTNPSLLAVTAETSVRAGIIAGNNLSAIASLPNAGNQLSESKLNGGMHNFPRFLEDWNWGGGRRFNFVGSLIPLYRSTQALGPYNNDAPAANYGAPIRNWSFDVTFKDPLRLPPGTPMFQHVEPTGFKQVL